MAKVSTATNRDCLAIDEKYYIQCCGRRPEPVLVEGKGCLVKDVEGKSYIDFTSGQVCAALGHLHPAVVAAVKKQLDKLWHTHSSFATLAQIELAERLAKITPGDLKKSYFLNTGGEAVEYALRLARYYTGKHEFIAPNRSYFGLTAGALSLTAHRLYKTSGAPFVPGALHVPIPDTYRCPFRCNGQCTYQCSDYIEEVIANESFGSLAAWISEVIPSAGGVIIPPEDYFRRVREIVKSYGMLMIFDEAQTAFGRTGKMFAFEHYGVVPDILVLSKSLGAGVPLSAAVTTPEIADKAVDKGLFHITSHTGDPLVCAAGSAGLEVVVKERLVERATRMGEHLRRRLDEMKETHELIGDVRSKGLIAGVEFVKDRKTKQPAEEDGGKVAELCMKRGLIINIARRKGTFSILRLAPPLVISPDEIDQAMDTLDKAIRDVSKDSKR